MLLQRHETEVVVLVAAMSLSQGFLLQLLLGLFRHEGALEEVIVEAFAADGSFAFLAVWTVELERHRRDLDSLPIFTAAALWTPFAG